MLLFLQRYSLVIRSFAITLLLTIFTEVFYPTVAMALTNGPTATEINGYAPEDSGHNVNLVNGGFSYSVPITSIPEYPMSINYSPGMGMEDEASCFGFGFNGFSGAISRTAIGIPDDINGAGTNVDIENQINHDVNVETDIALASCILNVCVGHSSDVGMYLEGGVMCGTDNQAKIAKLQKLEKISKTLKFLIAKNLNIGFNLGASSRTPGISYGVSLKTGFNTSLGIGGNTHEGLKSLGASVTYKPWIVGGDFVSLLNKIDNPEQPYPSVAIPTSSYLAPLAQINTDYYAGGVSIPAIIPVAPSIYVGGSLSGDFPGDMNRTFSSYGLMYLEKYDNSNLYHLADFGIEGESSFDEQYLHNPSYLQKDMFGVNCMGLSGNLQVLRPSYGIVSRNSNEMVSCFATIIGSFSNYHSVDRWHGSVKNTLGKGVDIIDVLKNSKKKSFALALFNEEKSDNMKKPFQGTGVLRMKGDLGGDYLQTDNSDILATPAKYNWSVEQAAGYKIKFLGLENRIPVYKSTLNENQIDVNQVKNKPANDIRKFTVKEVLFALQHKFAESIDTRLPNSSIEKSFYTHYSTVNKNSSNKSTKFTSDDKTSFNVFDDLLEKRITEKQYFGDVIADIRVKNAEGSTYIFNLPVFNKFSKEQTISGKKTENPDFNIIKDKYTNNQYDLQSSSNSVTKSNNFLHPYAWMLTAVVGEDYIDFDNIPGPSDGDLGYWVRFNYVKTADKYKWRFPFAGLSYSANNLVDNKDDIYSVNYGEKENYHLASIESSEYVCKYEYELRNDGRDAKGFNNGDAANTWLKPYPTQVESKVIGSNYSYSVSKIDLYKKNKDNDYSSDIEDGTIGMRKVKTTKFVYDYSLCKGVINNAQTFVSGSTVSELSGKLTLRSVQHITYDDEGNEYTLPSTTFKYSHENSTLSSAEKAKLNPNYESDRTDNWGNYVANNVEYYGGLKRSSPFTEISKVEADKNAKVFALEEVGLPTGGTLKIDYEANSYSAVQQYKPFVMRRVWDIKSIDNDKTMLLIDITDIRESSSSSDLSTIIKPGDILFSDICFYRSPISPNPSEVTTISGQTRLASLGAVIQNNLDKRYYQEIVLINEDADGTGKLVSGYRDYMHNLSLEMKAFKEAFSNCPTAKSFSDRYVNNQKDGGFAALRKFISNTINAFLPTSLYKNAFDNCFGTIGGSYSLTQLNNLSDKSTSKHIVSMMSYVRTPIFKAKYTGTRVKQVTLIDNFKYATNEQGTGRLEKSNSYTTNYIYENQATGASYGVATTEPPAGYDNVINVSSQQGAGFLPSPTLLYSKVRVSNDYEKITSGNLAVRDKGYTEHEFYTAKDKELQFNNVKYLNNSLASGNPGVAKGSFTMFGVFQWISFKRPKWLRWFKYPIISPLLLRWNRTDNYSQKSYSYTDYGDLLGRPKAVREFSAGADSSRPLSEQKFNYYDIEDKLPLLSPSVNLDASSFSDAFVKYARPGMVEQHWAEAYRTEKMSSYSLIIINKSSTRRNFIMNDMRYKYVPPVLKSIESSKDGLKTVAEFTKFDYFTGQAIETKYRDPEGNTKITQVIPAYWINSKMGPSSVEPTNLNTLTISTKEIQYKNSVSTSNVISSSITDWQKSGYGFTESVLQDGTTNTNTGISKQYTLLTPTQVENVYFNKQGIDKTYITESNDVFYKPVKQWVYKTELNNEGLYNTYTDFVFGSPTQTPQWQIASTITKYDVHGSAVESKDILGKYISSKIGYYYSHGISQSANAPASATAFEGAEVSYKTKTGNIILDATNVQLGAASILTGKCKTETHTLSSSTLIGKSLNIVSWCLPSTVQFNVPFAKINVIFKTNNGNINRTLFVSLSENNKINVVSNRGEVFKGFFLNSTQDANCLSQQFITDPSVVTISSVEAIGSTNYNVKMGTKILSNCDNGTSFIYTIPSDDCFPDAIHTGQRAFALAGNGAEGTIATIKKSDFTSEMEVNKTGFNRDYKAMVWVHTSSASGTKLVAKVDGIEVASNTISTPYTVAGNWKLLRVDLKSNQIPTTALQITFSVVNTNTTASNIAYYDDFRVLPTNAAMSVSVYNPLNGRLTSTLDDNNFATWITYDGRGRVAKTEVEIANVGKKTVKKHLYNDQNKQ